MSVTLKLADEDAAVVGSILRAFSENGKLKADEEGFKQFFYAMRSASGHRTFEHIGQIAGAFQIAVRANQR